MLEERRRERRRERRDAEDRGGRRAGAGDETLAEPSDDEDGDEKEHARREHADQPERGIALRLPVDGRLRDPERALELVRGYGEERHAGRLVRVRAAAKTRAVEEIRLEHERVVEHEMPRQLVARAVLRAGEADRRQRRERHQHEHERLEPVPPESHRRNATRSRYVVMSRSPWTPRSAAASRYQPIERAKAPAATSNATARAAPPGRQAVERREHDADRRATRSRVVDVHRPGQPDDVEEDVHEQEPGRDDARAAGGAGRRAPAAAASAGSVTVRTISQWSGSKGHHDQMPCKRQDPASFVTDLLRRLVEPDRDDEPPEQ